MRYHQQNFIITTFVQCILLWSDKYYRPNNLYRPLDNLEFPSGQASSLKNSATFSGIYWMAINHRPF